MICPGSLVASSVIVGINRRDEGLPGMVGKVACRKKPLGLYPVHRTLRELVTNFLSSPHTGKLLQSAVLNKDILEQATTASLENARTSAVRTPWGQSPFGSSTDLTGISSRSWGSPDSATDILQSLYRPLHPGLSLPAKRR